MLVTLQSVFPKLNAGGFISIEDIHGTSYVESFFKPAAAFLGTQHLKGTVASVHVYPFVLLAHKSGNSGKLPHLELGASVPNLKGGTITLSNPGWGSFLTEQALSNFFQHFGHLHESAWTDAPVGCERTSNPVCTVTVTNGAMQALLTGVDIYADRAVVHVASARPVIRAVRKGTEWIGYGL